MSQSPDAPFFTIRPERPARVKAALQDLNTFAESPQHGAPLEVIKKVHHDRLRRGTKPDVVDPKDLVGLLIADPDNKPIWDALIGNSFCKQMGTTKKDDPDAPKVLSGFKAYMVQDYIYIVRAMDFQNGRTQKATTTTDFDDTADKAGRYGGYSKEALHLCVDQDPTGLGMNDGETLPAADYKTSVLDDYTNFQIATANGEDWVMGLVAMIPCFQSYDKIAQDLYDQEDIDKTTAWYKLWVKPNSGGTSAEEQISFFKANYDQWKNRYAEAKAIFQQACEGEIALWQYAVDNENLA